MKHPSVIIGGLLVTSCLIALPSPLHASGSRWADLPMPYMPDDFGGYGLDSTPRSVTQTTRGGTICPAVDLVTYSGTYIRFKRNTRVYSGLVPHIAAFEELAADVGRRVYGRAPRAIIHKGTYNCRAVRGVPGLLSEHGLANALDLAGFEFAPLTRAEIIGANDLGVPRPLRGRFETNVRTHWNARGPSASAVAHERFWKLLSEELRNRPTMFREMLGPGYPGHDDHLHLSMAPWSIRAMY